MFSVFHSVVTWLKNPILNPSDSHSSSGPRQFRDCLGKLLVRANSRDCGHQHRSRLQGYSLDGDLLRVSQSIVAAFVVLFTVACYDQSVPTEPDTQPTEASLQQVISQQAISEDITLRPAFTEEEPQQLAPTGEAIGDIFNLKFAQNFDQQEQVLTLQVQIENNSEHSIWRPIRLKARGLRPKKVFFTDADNEETRAGAIWDYGQQISVTGNLEPQQESGARSITVGIPAPNEASLRSLELHIRVSGILAPEYLPTPLRTPNGEEADRGYGAGTLLVFYDDESVSSEDIADINLQYGIAGQDFNDAFEAYVAFLENSSFEHTLEVRDRLATDPSVRKVKLVGIVERFATTSAPFPGSVEIENHHLLGRFQQAWEKDVDEGQAPGEEVIVGIIDSGVGPGAHEVFQRTDVFQDVRFGRLAQDSAPEDTHGHGTKVASVVVATANGHGTVGAAYGARIASLKMADWKCENRYDGEYLWNVQSALTFIREYNSKHPDRPISVVNMSWGWYPDEELEFGPEDPELSFEEVEEQFDQLWSQGVVFVAAAGNDEERAVAWPASYEKVIAVPGTDNRDIEVDDAGDTRWSDQVVIDPCTEENFPQGSTYFGLGGVGSLNEVLAAPAENIPVVGLTNKVESSGATSMAAPQVAALAAILRARRPRETWSAPDLEMEMCNEFTVEITDGTLNGACGRIVAHHGTVVTFPDPNLEAAVREAIGKPEGDIFQSDLKDLTRLRARSADISNLRGLEHATKLTRLDLVSNQISELSPLAGLSNLERLGLRGNQISGLSPLSDLTTLEILDLDLNEISDLTPLADLNNLDVLRLSDNQISDLSPLTGLNNLDVLLLWNNQISDLSPLANLVGLTGLDLSRNQISDLSPLTNLVGLTGLSLSGNQISDLSPLAGLNKLLFVKLADNQIADLSPLANVTNLRSLTLDLNEISDLSPLAGLNDLEFIRLRQNQISDLSPLAGLNNLDVLWLGQNQISGVEALVDNDGLGDGDFVELHSNPLSQAALCQDIPTLQSRGVRVDHDGACND